MQAETARTLKSSFVSAMLIKHRPPLTLYQKKQSYSFPTSLKQSINLNPDAKLQIYLKKWKMITLQSCCLSRQPSRYHVSLRKKTLSSNIILHKLE